MALQWDAASMSTGFDDVDRQHQQLIDHTNTLFSLMGEGRGKEGIAEFVDFLAGYAETHFRHEEGCMEEHRCPVAAANKIQHMAFSRLMAGYRQRLMKDGPSASLAIEVQGTVSEWLRNHIVKTDTHLRSCAHTVGS